MLRRRHPHTRGSELLAMRGPRLFRLTFPESATCSPLPGPGLARFGAILRRHSTAAYWILWKPAPLARSAQSRAFSEDQAIGRRYHDGSLAVEQPLTFLSSKHPFRDSICTHRERKPDVGNRRRNGWIASPALDADTNGAPGASASRTGLDQTPIKLYHSRRRRREGGN